MTLVNGYLAFKYHTDKEMILREFTNGIALAMCAEAVEGEGGPWRRRRAARDRSPSMRRWLDVIVGTYPTLCSTGERSASAEPGEKGSVGSASCSTSLWGARLARTVSIRANRSLSGCATSLNMACSDTVGI